VRVLIRSALAIMTAFAAAPTFAQDAASTYPNRPIRVVVPFAPGGPNDIIARSVGHKLQEAWGQPVVVENRPGAGGNIGMEQVANSPPDGYSLVMSSGRSQSAHSFIRSSPTIQTRICSLLRWLR